MTDQALGPEEVVAAAAGAAAAVGAGAAAMVQYILLHRSLLVEAPESVDMSSLPSDRR